MEFKINLFCLDRINRGNSVKKVNHTEVKKITFFFHKEEQIRHNYLQKLNDLEKITN